MSQEEVRKQRHLRVGDKILTHEPLKEEKGLVIHIFDKNKIPDVELVRKYYGIDESSPVFKGATNTSRNNRVVIQKDSGGYLILIDSDHYSPLFSIIG